jgi:hypothetical protein
VTENGFKKKAMKTTKTKIEATAPANVQKSFSVSKTGQAAQKGEKQQQAFLRHCANRKLSTKAVLNYLRARLPREYELAEVVGRWIWLDVAGSGKRGLASVLWLSGFHWNKRRGVWQHPCGIFDPFGSHPSDPRSKYSSRLAADIQPA